MAQAVSILHSTWYLPLNPLIPLKVVVYVILVHTENDCQTKQGDKSQNIQQNIKQWYS